MKTPDKDEILRIKIRKSRKSLLEAKTLIENNFSNAALSRLYYACYYAATALLLKKDILTKTHAGVKQMLGLHYINTGVLTFTMGEFYSDILASRQKADYDELEEADAGIVKEYFIIANQFVDAAQKLLDL